MAKFTSEILEIFANCLSAVESGGQIYGNGDWGDVTLQYTNSPNEHAITIGAYQRMGVEAKADLVRIRKDYPEVFKKLDTVGISADLDASDWSKYQLPSKTCAKAKAISNIIKSTEGIRVQKLTIAEDVQKYADWIENKYGVHRIDALLHLVNVRHLGGTKPLERIIGRISGEVTLEKVKDSLLKDTVRNQVGAEPYRKRQALMYQWIHEKITPLLDSSGLVKSSDNNTAKEETTVGVTAQDYLNVWRSWVGFSEANGKFKQIIDLYNSMKPLPRGYAVKYTDEWCDTTVSAAAIKAGCVDLVGRECGCEEHVKIFKSMGIWIEDGTITPHPGDIILFNWDSSVQPNNGYSDHIGVVESVSNGKITTIEGNKGEAVARRVLSVGNGNIRGFARPKWAAASSGNTNSPSTPSSGTGVSREVSWYGYIKSNVKTRTWAGTENKQLTSYPVVTKGSKVGVCDTIKDKDGDPWYFVKISGDKGDKYGFVPADYVSKSTPSTSTELKDDGKIEKTPKWTGKVTASVLNVRTWAGTENPKIKSWPQLGKGNLVDVCDLVHDKDGDPWYYIRIDGRIYGFVSAAYITRV